MKSIFLILLTFLIQACSSPFHFSATTNENGVPKKYYFGSTTVESKNVAEKSDTPPVK